MKKPNSSTTITLRLPVEAINIIHKVARRRGVSRSALLREAIGKVLADDGISPDVLEVEPEGRPRKRESA